MPIKINSFQHLGIPVTDLHRSEYFYERLGFNIVMSTAFEFNDGKGLVSMMQRGNMIIELYQMPENELHEIRSRQNGHIDHIAFDVDDIEKTYEQLKEQSFTIIEPKPIFLSFWKNGCWYFNVEGPDAERLEFNQIIK